MDLTIASLLDVVDRLGWIGGRTDLLTYPEYVLFKGIDTMIDEKRIRLSLKLNVYVLPFNPKALIQESSIINNEEKNEEKQERNKITSTKHNTITQRQTQEKWVEVSVKNSRYTKVKENEMKTKKQQLDKSSLTKKKMNRYQELKEKEKEEEENKNEEDYKVEIKMNVIGNENGKHDWNEDSYHIEGVSMETLEKEIDQQLLNDRKHIRDDDTDSKDDDRSYVLTDSLGLTSKEREEYEVLHRKMNQEEGSEEGSDVSNDIPLVPLELLDKMEDKLLISEENCERLRNEKVAVERQYKNKIDSLEKALRNKTELLIKALKDKGDTDVRVKTPDNELYLI